MSNDYYSNVVMSSAGNVELFVRIGFCPDIVKVTNSTSGVFLLWNRARYGHSAGAVASGGLCYTGGGMGVDGATGVDVTGGIALCEFTGGTADVAWGQIDYPGDPATVDGTNWIKANGIKISPKGAADASSTGLKSNRHLLGLGSLLIVEAWRMNHIFLRLYLDQGDGVHTYVQDNSYDFKELGVSGNGNWLVYNQTNGNYCYVKEVRKQNGKSKWSRIYTATDAEGTPTTAADFDDDDVCYVFPINAAPFPMADIGKMT